MSPYLSVLDIDPVMRLFFCLSAVPHSGKDKKMKALRNFDYDLWTTEEGQEKKYWIRVKATGEVTQVSHEVIAYLRNEEKQLRRDMESERARGGQDLSYDFNSCEDQESSWLTDTNDMEAEVIGKMRVEEFQSTLTVIQRLVFQECILEGKTYERFGQEHGIGKTAVSKHITLIRKKAKIFFG